MKLQYAMNKYSKLLLIALITLSSTSFAGTNSKNLVIVSEGADNGHEAYKVLVDKNSIKNVKKDTVLFNLVTTGLGLDETITFAEPTVSAQVEDSENLDHTQVVVVSEMNCITKELKPLKYTQYDHTTGSSKEQIPNSQPTSEEFEADDLILNNIHKTVC